MTIEPVRKSDLPCIPAPAEEFFTWFAHPGGGGDLAHGQFSRGAQIRRRVSYGDWEPVAPGHWAEEPPGATTVPSAPADSAERRDRYAAAIRDTSGWVLDDGQHMLDAVMAVADAEHAAVRKLVKRLVAHAKGFQDVLEEGDGGAWGKTVGADIEALRTAALALPAPADRAEVEAHRLALSQAVGLGTGAPWDAIQERAAELRRLADEAQQAEPSWTPGPVALGRAVESARQAQQTEADRG